MVDFIPFHDDNSQLTIGGLNIENSDGKLIIHGSLELSRDPSSLQAISALRMLLSRAAHILASGDALEADKEPSVAPESVRNPFI